jgi:hypothetical protein
MLTPESAARKDRAQPSGDAMQHRHFATIAAIIRNRFGERQTSTEWTQDDIANAFADELARTNPRFDRARFLRACAD